MLLFLPPSCTSPHISPDTCEGTQDKEGIGFRGAGGEEVTEGAVVVVTSDDCGGGIFDTGVGASVDVNIVVAALVYNVIHGMVGMVGM